MYRFSYPLSYASGITTGKSIVPHPDLEHSFSLDIRSTSPSVNVFRLDKQWLLSSGTSEEGLPGFSAERRGLQIRLSETQQTTEEGRPTRE